jgi:hypothetical protein
MLELPSGATAGAAANRLDNDAGEPRASATVDGESLWPRLAALSLVIEAFGRPDGRHAQQPAAAKS